MYRKQRNWTCYHVIHPPFVFITQNQGHYLYYITVRTGQVYPPPRPRQECINEFIIQRLNPLVVVDLHSAYVMNSELTPEVVIKFLPAQFSWIWCKCLQNDFIHSKIFSIWPKTEELWWKIHCSSQKQECRFEFETGRFEFETGTLKGKKSKQGFEVPHGNQTWNLWF